MIKEVLSSLKEKMSKTVEVTSRELATIHTGRATPHLLDRVKVEYYGSQVPLNQLAGISIPEPRLIVVQPWDKAAVKEIEKSIWKSNLGLTPVVDGHIIRIPIPPLSEERRKELVKVVKNIAEEGRIAVRGFRRWAKEELEKLQKEDAISEDDNWRAQEEIQKITDQFIEEIDRMLESKEKEIMEV